MGLKQKIRNYNLRQSRNTSYKSLAYPGFSKLKSLAILFMEGEDSRHVLEFRDQLTKAGKQVSLLAFIPQKRKEIQNAPSFDFFTKDELNWLGRPQSELVKQFLSQKHEVIITLGQGSENPFQFIITTAKTDFVIGLKSAPNTRVDLSLGSEDQNDLSKVFKEIEYYLGFINKTE